MKWNYSICFFIFFISCVIIIINFNSNFSTCLLYNLYEGVKKDVSIDKPFDFRTAKEIGQDITVAGGYDHNYCFDDKDGEIRARSVFFSIDWYFL